MAFVLHRLAVVLSVLAFLSGIAAQTPGALGAVNGPMVMGQDDMGCADMDSPQAQAGGDVTAPTQIGAHHKAPARGMKPDCMKSGCVCPANLPARTAAPVPTARPAAAYWSPERPHTGLAPAPEPFPPIAA